MTLSKRSTKAGSSSVAARYAEFDTHDELGVEHTLLDAVANPLIAQKIAPYVWNPGAAAGPTQTATESRLSGQPWSFRRWFGTGY